jgi:hypothetical protein
MRCRRSLFIERSSRKSSPDLPTRSAFCAVVRMWGSQRRCLSTKPKAPVKCREIVVQDWQSLCAICRTDANGISSRVWRIASSKGFSTVSGVGCVQLRERRVYVIVEYGIASAPRVAFSSRSICVALRPRLAKKSTTVDWSIWLNVHFRYISL